MLDELIREAYGWLADCGCPTSGMTDIVAIRTVHFNYVGGWVAFVEADSSLDVAVVWLLMVRRFGIDSANELFPQSDSK
jgi:hypothetical protein